MNLFRLSFILYFFKSSYGSKLCCYSYHIYGTWRSKKMGEEVSKQLFGGGKPQRGESVFMEGVDPSRHYEGVSHYVILL